MYVGGKGSRLAAHSSLCFCSVCPAVGGFPKGAFFCVWRAWLRAYRPVPSELWAEGMASGEPAYRTIVVWADIYATRMVWAGGKGAYHGAIPAHTICSKWV